MSIDVIEDYVSVGGNRHSAASVYCNKLESVIYGADHNIALWRPSLHSVHQVLQGHTEKVTAIAASQRDVADHKPLIISGAANGEILLWRSVEGRISSTPCSRCVAHNGSVNVITTIPDSNMVVTGGADAFVKIWMITDDQLVEVAIIKPQPRIIPLALAAGKFAAYDIDKGFFLAVAGTRNDIQLYSVSIEDSTITPACSLTGHEGWIRSLTLRPSKSGFLLASTSADKYIRLWKLNNGHALPELNGATEKANSEIAQTLTAKVKTVGIGEAKYSVTFESLLLGHEDWVYSADWLDGDDEKLLTASADGTLAIWESDPMSGIWVSETRLGEISGQKGATTATGSSGGFWTGKWIDQTTIVSLGRTGSWRKWQYDSKNMFWELKPGITGHIDSVNGLCWSPKGEYLLTTSTDQTTRLHAEWRRDDKRTWHEFSRCQIHGYNCNTVTCINAHQFASGADEKLLRVFNEPKELAETLQRLCGIQLEQYASLPDAAAIPVLGLSNKEMGEPDDIIEAGPRKGDDDYAAANALAGISIRGVTEPPTEDLLSRHTLWPEHEKLYGHGYEISEAAYGHGILATACKASSIDHATIRLYDPDNDWRQIEPPITAHSLTVTRLVWSISPDRYLLSVGRDRQWTVFKMEEDSKVLRLFQTMPKAHTRMILDAAFSPAGEQPFFATAGRDKIVKLWSLDESTQQFRLATTITRPTPVTAIDIISNNARSTVLAVGEENGSLSLHFLDPTLVVSETVELSSSCLNKTINRLAWRHKSVDTQEISENTRQLAIAGADASVRILSIGFGIEGHST